MYTIDSEYYDREFDTIDELIADVLKMGADPSNCIVKDGRVTDETLWDLMEV